MLDGTLNSQADVPASAGGGCVGDPSSRGRNVAKKISLDEGFQMRLTIHRRTACIALCLTPAVAAAQATDTSPARIAIIDASVDTRPFLDGLAAAGVKIIGRYFARCPQGGGLERKRFIDNPGDTERKESSEIDAILTHKANFGVLSVYQYNSSQASKFLGTSRYGVPVAPGEGQQNWMTCEQPSRPLTARQEGQLDAEAAVGQAKLIKQPPGTAIYFGIDLDFNAQLKAGVLEYFGEVRKALSKAGYLVGAYGNGDALDLLRKPPNRQKPLIDLAWINASRGHGGNVGVFNRGDWDLLQTTTDLDYKLPGGSAVNIDIDVQNADRAGKYIGFWRRREAGSDGKVLLPVERTSAIQAARRFSCHGVALVTQNPGDAGGIAMLGCAVAKHGCDPIRDKDGNVVDADPDLRRKVCFGNVTRVLAEDPTRAFLQVDCDEDGQPDGWVAATALSPDFKMRPAWVSDRERRIKLTRKDTLCERRR
jgi:hypothetical protein